MSGGILPSESGALNKLEPIPWRGFRVVEKLIALVLFLAAVAVLALPFIDAVMVRRLARLTGATNVVSWLINDWGTWIVGAALLALLAAFLFLVRRRLIKNKALWFGAGCPNCMERELVRVSRKGSDRFYGLMAIPAYRYACRNCTWRGLRIARREQSFEREAELEAALLRFNPDSPAPLLSPNADPSADPDLPAVGATPAPGSMFRDSGDVAFLDEPRGRPRFEAVDPDVEAMGEDSNHQAGAEPIEGMEWLWRRSSDS